ncbi:MAG: hypothetical protein ACQEVA_05185 [Myxococcota bacterium]
MKRCIQGGVFLVAFVLLAAACGGADKPAEAGEECDADRETPCVEGYVCAPDSEGTDRCQKPVGASCDPAADSNDCVAGSDCFEVDSEMMADEPQGQCLVTEAGECDAQSPQCAPHLTCAEKQSGEFACFAPVFIEGDVTDSTDGSAIEGARIIGLDEVKVAVTDVSVSDADGNYQLALPVVRDDEGSPIDAQFTLRADAQDYQTFPSGLRTALPINTSQATREERGYVITGTPTEIVLIPLPDAQQGNPSISGSVAADERNAGVLVVAEGAGNAISAVTDVDGDYTIFNVPSGSYEVKGYAAGIQLEPAAADVADQSLEDVDLTELDEELSTVSGSVSIVDAAGGLTTSVILVVESTFDETFARGEVPPGLRDPYSGEPDVDGSFTIEDVPNGDYVILAAFENDELVRDPDQNIGGTGFVTVSVPDGDVRDISVGETFKVTEALDVFEPGSGRPEAVTGSPTLRWEDDSSEAYYTVEVYNAYGDLVWEDQNIPSVSGGGEVTVQYGGPTESGMYYQFRAKSWRAPGGQNDSPISATEDLKGVFYYE